MAKKSITEERSILVCDMCKGSELTHTEPLLGETYTNLHYEILQAFKLEGKSQASVRYESFPKNTIFIEQRSLFNVCDRFRLCYSCYEKVKRFILGEQDTNPD